MVSQNRLSMPSPRGVSQFVAASLPPVRGAAPSAGSLSRESMDRDLRLEDLLKVTSFRNHGGLMHIGIRAFQTNDAVVALDHRLGIPGHVVSGRGALRARRASCPHRSGAVASAWGRGPRRADWSRALRVAPPASSGVSQ